MPMENLIIAYKNYQIVVAVIAKKRWLVGVAILDVDFSNDITLNN